MEESRNNITMDENHASPTTLYLKQVAQNQFSIDQIKKSFASLNIIEIESTKDYEILYKSVETLVQLSFVKSLSEEKDYGPEDFPTTAENAVNTFKILTHLFSKLKITIKLPKHQRNILIPVLIFCGNHSGDFPWSNSIAVQCSTVLCENILLCFNFSSIKELLNCVFENQQFSLFKNILLDLRPMLCKDTWYKNPPVCYTFRWLLFHMTHPNLTDYLPDILPPALMFTDHHNAKYKILGIKCLDHIIDNVPPTELKMYGRADVVYDALFHMTYTKESEIISVLYPCILRLLMGQDGSLHRKETPRRWCRYDDVYNRLIWNMDMEDTLVLRREYSKIAPEFIEVMGITIAKHLKRTMRVFLEYLSVHDGPNEISRINSLNALCVLIKVAWPRMEHHCEEIMKSIFALLYDMETEFRESIAETAFDKLLLSIKECLSLLKIACPKKFPELIDEIKTLNSDFPGLKLISDFLNDDA